MTSDTLSVEGLEIPSDVHSLDGFRRWVDTLGERGPRVAFFRGKVHVEMSPQDLFRHEPLVAAVNLELARRARDGNLGRYYFPPTWLGTRLSACRRSPMERW